MYYIINIFGDVDVLLQSSVCRPPKNRIKSTTMIFFHNYGMFTETSLVPTLPSVSPSGKRGTHFNDACCGFVRTSLAELETAGFGWRQKWSGQRPVVWREDGVHTYTKCV